VDLVNATRTDSEILQGASPRATLAVTAMAKAVARLSGRDYVVPEDVHRVFQVTIAHRVFLTPAAESRGRTAEAVLERILASVRSPRVG